MPKQGPTPDNLTEVMKTAGIRPGAPEGEAIGHFDITIAKDGSWYYRGTPIRRVELCKLFATVLRRENDGSYWLVTPVERGRIEVEDAPFTAVEMDVQGTGGDQILRFRTNLDHMVDAGADHPIRVQSDDETGEPRPYLAVRDGLEALILRPVYYEMVARAVERQLEGRRMLGVWSGGCFFAIGPVPE